MPINRRDQSRYGKINEKLYATMGRKGAGLVAQTGPVVPACLPPICTAGRREGLPVERYHGEQRRILASQFGSDF